MAPLVLRKANGDEIPLIASSPLRGYSRGEQKIDLLTADTLTLTVSTTHPADIGIGDTLPIFGQLYTINQIPADRREGEDRFVYELTLEGPQYHLLRVVFLDTDVAGGSLSSIFSLTGNLAFFAGVLFNNMARVFSGAWGLGTVQVPGESVFGGTSGTVVEGDQTETKTLDFNGENCLGVLQRLCSEWGTEFWIEYRPADAPNRILNIGPAGQVQPDTYSYGQGKGLYQLERRSVQNTVLATRAYIFGSDKNLPVPYRSTGTRLQLPEGTSPGAGPQYIQNTEAVAKYGLIEATQIFEQILPDYTGTVAEVVPDGDSFTDPDLGFNPFAYDQTKVVGGNTVPIYTYQIEGVAPKVHFQTGGLAGYSFELVTYFENNATLRLRRITENGLELPSRDPASPFYIKPGDTYVLIDIVMPDELVTAAENKLLAAGQAWLAENSSPAVEYTLTFDELYLQKKAGDSGPIPLDNPPSMFTAGDQIRIVDTELGIDRYARITGFTRDVIRPYKYTLTLGDPRKLSLLSKILKQQLSLKGLVQSSGANSPLGVQTPPADQIPTKTGLKEYIDSKLKAIGTSVPFFLTATPVPTGFTAHHPLTTDEVQLIAEVRNLPRANPQSTILARIQAGAIKKFG